MQHLNKLIMGILLYPELTKLLTLIFMLSDWMCIFSGPMWWSSVTPSMTQALNDPIPCCGRLFADKEHQSKTATCFEGQPKEIRSVMWKALGQASVLLHYKGHFGNRHLYTTGRYSDLVIIPVISQQKVQNLIAGSRVCVSGFILGTIFSSHYPKYAQGW